MKRYNRIWKSLFPDIIPALEKAHEKWIEGANQAELHYISWWQNKGKSPCSLCDLIDGNTDKRCPLDDYNHCAVNDGDKCCIEWENCYEAADEDEGDYPKFNKNAIMLRARIGKLLERAKGMV
ncbi:MAG TPA: hypothetical protein ENH82_11405 [bacterium]|nr:hypothetical protein [bacterium]